MFQVTNLETLQKALEFINANELLAYDTETTGLNPRKDRIIGFGVSNSETGFYIPLLAWDGRELKTTQALDNSLHVPLLQALASRKLLMFNASFDARFTKYQFGIDLVPPLHTDVLLLKHTCDEEFPFGLKEIAAKLFGQDVKAEKEAMQASIKSNGGTATEYFKASTDLLAQYCVQDCVLTFRVYNHYIKKLKTEGLEKFYYEDEVLPLYKEVTIPLEECGIQLDMPKLHKALEEITKDIAALEDDIQMSINPHLELFRNWFLNKDYPVQTRTGKQPAWARKGLTQHEAWARDNPNAYMFNLQSKFHLKKLFFDTLQLKPLSRTPTGLPQVDEDFMDSIVAEVPWVGKLIQYNKLNKIKSTYVERFIHESEGGIFYPSFYQHRTVSGRFGSDIQQLPRPIDSNDLVSKHNNVVREFICARPRRKLVSADYEQLEPSIFAHTSTDSALQQIFSSGRDFYSEVAIRTERLRGVSSDKNASDYLGKINKSARQKAKSYALGIAYGMTGYKLQFELNVPQEAAEALVQDYLNAFPGLRKWMYESQDKVKYDGQIKTQAGRVRHLPKAKQLFARYGERLRDSLQLWKDFNTTPEIYATVKEERKTYINLLNNAINFQVQGLAASIVNRAAIAINRKLKTEQLNAALIMQVHDELVYECDEGHIEALSALVKHEMENIMKLTVPLRTTPQVGNNFRECK